MSWLFSRAMVVAFSEGSSSDGAACALWSGMPMPQACLWHGKTTAAWSRFPSGMTCAPLTDVHGEAVLTWFLAVFPVRTSHVLAKERESTGSEAGCGWRWRESSVRWDRATSSWRTRQCSLFGGLEEFSGTWWRWGMMRSGECWELMMPELHTEGNESGSWDGPAAVMFPTPDTGLSPNGHGARGGKPGNGHQRGESLISIAKHGMWPTPKANDPEKRGNFDMMNPRNGLPAAVKRSMWTTPSATDGARGGVITEKMTGTSLAQQIKTPAKWRTPTVDDSSNVSRQSGAFQSLTRSVREMLPTPTVQDASNNGGPSQMERNTPPLNAVAGGALNPTWVEWLMGWPLGWTDCGASGMDRFRQWCVSHGERSRGCGTLRRGDGETLRQSEAG